MAGKNAFTVSAQRTGKKVLLTLSGYIFPGSERTSSAAIAEKLNAMKDGDELTVLIRNCNGGSVIEGMTIFHDLAELRPTVLIDGVAASMGAIIALAGETIKMSRHSKQMLHRLQMVAEGDPDQVADAVDQAKEYENELVAIVARRTGLKAEKARKLYFTSGKDVWLDAAQCLKAGLIDQVVKGSLRRDIPSRELREQDPEGVVAVFEAAMKPRKAAPAAAPDHGLQHAFVELTATIKEFLGMKKKPTQKKRTISVDVSQKTNSTNVIKAIGAQLKKHRVNAFLVEATEKVKNASDLAGRDAKRVARIKALKAELAAEQKKTAKLTKQITAGAPETRKKKDPKVAGSKADPMASVHDANLPWNAQADEVFGKPGSNKKHEIKKKHAKAKA